jgi:HEAT repeat protein
MLSGKFSLKIALAAVLLAAVPASLFSQGAPMTTTLPRPEEVSKLIATLQSADSSHHDKVVACHRLAIIGPKEAVPALAALLTDEKLAHMARHALEPMTDPAAAAALRDALGKVKGLLLVGVINSIGFRRDAAATGALAGLLSSPDEQVTTAAAAALGRIGTVEAAKKLQGTLSGASGARLIAFADASLTCAERLVADRQRDEATAIFDRLVGAGFPNHIRTAAMCGAITARQAAGIPMLVQQLKSQDKAMLAAAWRAARELPGPNVTKALAAELGRLPAEKQVLLIQVFGDRADKAALTAVLEAAKSGSSTVRVAALQALPRVDDGKSSLPILLQAVTAGQNAAESDAALVSLGQIGGPEANAKILAALPAVTPAMRARLIGVLGERRAENATRELLQLAANADAEIGKAAFRALALVAQPRDLPELIRLSNAVQDAAVKVPAVLAVFSVSMKIDPVAKRIDPVLNAYRAATDAKTRCSLLQPLGAIVKATGGSPQVFDTVKLALNDPDASVRDAALRCVADWPDASPAAMMLEIVNRDPDPAHREVALRGGIRMAANVAAGRDSTRLDYLAWFKQANQAVRTVEEKLMIISGLGNVSQIEGLQLLQPYLDDPAVQTEAALAVVKIAPALAGSQHAAAVKRTLEKITSATKDPDIRRKAGKMAKSIQTKAKN